MKGTVRERSPGHWELRVFIGNDPVTGRPRQATKTVRGGKRAAQSELARFVAEIEDGRRPLSGAATVAQMLDRYLEYLTPLREPTTVRGYRTVAARIKAKLGSVQVKRLDAQMLDRAYRDWLAEGLSPTTVHHHHELLSGALRQAVRWGVVPAAVTAMASPPPLKSPPVPEIEPDVIRQLVVEAEHSRQPILATAIALAAITGCRRGELCALRWEDLDIEAGVIRIRHAIKHGLERSAIVVGDTKTHAERTIALDGPTLAVLARHRVQVDAWCSAAGVEPSQTGYILSLDPQGIEPLKPDSLGQAYRRIRDRVGVTVRFHDLRHFAATQLIGAGVDPVTVAGRLGHADPSVTLRIYAAAMAQRDREAAGILGELVAGSPVSEDIVDAETVP